MTSTMITLETVCPFCGQVTEVLVYEDDYYAWRYGDKLIQDAFPYLTANEREMVKTGICGACWDAMFGLPEEEEKDDFSSDSEYEIISEEYIGCTPEEFWAVEDDDSDKDDWDFVENDEDHNDYDIDEADLELGFNPYLGSYDFDC